MKTENKKHIDWWNGMTLEQQFYKTIEANHLIEGDNTRHPHTLTVNEIEKIYQYFKGCLGIKK